MSKSIHHNLSMEQAVVTLAILINKYGDGGQLRITREDYDNLPDIGTVDSIAFGGDIFLVVREKKDELKH